MTRQKCVRCRRDAHPCYGIVCEDCWVARSRPRRDEEDRTFQTADGVKYQHWGGDRHRAGVAVFDLDTFVSSDPFVSTSSVEEA